MVYLVFDESLYFQLNGNRQQSPRPQALRLLESHARNVMAAFLDYEVKIVPAPEGHALQKERMIAAAFPANYVIQTERIGQNQYMVIGADKAKLNTVYDGLLPLKVDQLLPYGVGVRAYLNKNGLLSTDGITVCVDDLKAYLVISIFEGTRFNSPRRIVFKDDAHLASEIKRSLQAYLSDNPISRDKQINIITNQTNWLDILRVEFQQGLINSFESLCPCIDGLMLAKFNMHFRSLEDLLRQKRRTVLVNRIKTMVVSLVLIFLGLGSYGLVWGYSQNKSTEYLKAQVALDDIRSQLKEMNVHKISALLQRSGFINYVDLYIEFYNRIPSGYQVKNWSILTQDDRGQCVFKAAIYPSSTIVSARTFRLTGLFQQAKLEAAMVEKVLGQVITLEIKQEEVKS